MRNLGMFGRGPSSPPEPPTNGSGNPSQRQWSPAQIKTTSEPEAQRWLYSPDEVPRTGRKESRRSCQGITHFPESDSHAGQTLNQLPPVNQVTPRPPNLSATQSLGHAPFRPGHPFGQVTLSARSPFRQGQLRRISTAGADTAGGVFTSSSSRGHPCPPAKPSRRPRARPEPCPSISRGHPPRLPGPRTARRRWPWSGWPSS